MPESATPDLKTVLKSLKNFSIRDLEEVQKKAGEAITKKVERERNDAIKAAKEIKEKYGITVEELFPKTASSDNPTRPE